MKVKTKPKHFRPIPLAPPEKKREAKKGSIEVNYNSPNGHELLSYTVEGS